jgi:hypothetical protein
MKITCWYKKRLQNTLVVSGSLETAQCVNFLN